MISTHPFKPIIDAHSTVLVLGTFPSIKSFEENFYYGHPRNQFWPIMQELFNEKLSTIAEKLRYCQKYHIALWDIFAEASREKNNSSDTNLKNTRVNDIQGLLQEFPKITHIFFTSKSAQKAFNKYFNHLDISTLCLPSPSPAHAALSLESKIEIYRKDFFPTISNANFK